MVFKNCFIPRFFSATLLLIICLAPLSHAEPETSPYVIGASVSMGFNLIGRGHSPSVYTLKQMGYDEDQIIKKTILAGSYRRKFAWLQEKLQEKPPSIILGIDIFHHDLRRKKSIPEKTYAYVNEFLDVMHQTGVPVILGSIWTSGDNEATVEKMNKYLQERVSHYDNIYLLPADQILNCFKKPNRQFTYEVDGVSLSFDQRVRRRFFVDTVHPNNRGARIISNLMIKILNEKAGVPTPYYDVTDIVELLQNIYAKYE